jgi:hypothetical protein
MARCVLLLLATLTIAGCPAAHSDYPTQACKVDSDCYEGEHCLNNTICVSNGADMAKKLDMTAVDMVMP